MSKHPVYGLLYIILLPFALLFGLSTLAYLLLSTQMPAFLVVAFVTGCFAIYTVATLLFYIKVIQQQKSCKRSLLDWIRVNAFVIFIPSVFLLLVGAVAAINPSAVQISLQKTEEIQGQKMPFSVSGIRLLLYILMIYAASVLIHIIYTFRLLKEYFSVFGQDKPGNV